MIEALIERAVQTELCRALERSLQEAGLPPGVAQEMCSRLLSHAPVDEEQADAAAAASLGVEDEEDLYRRPAEQSVPSAVQISAGNEEGSRAETLVVDDLVAWMIPALEDGATWVDIARVAAGQEGHDLHKVAQRAPTGSDPH